MKNPGLTLLAAAFAASSLAPAWPASTVTAPTPTTPVPSSTVGANASASADARLRAECFNATTRVWRTTGSCAAFDADGNLAGSVTTPGTALDARSAAAATPSTYANKSAKSSASTQVPDSLKGPSPLNPSSPATSGMSTVK